MRLDDHQNNHKMFPKTLDMVCLAKKYHLVIKKPYKCILTLKLDFFAISKYRALHPQEINLV